MNRKPDAVVGAILAGGKSVRMGQDKALLPLNGQPLIQHVAAAMRDVIDSVYVVSDRATRYASLNIPGIADIVRHAGPMGGIHAALRTLQAPAVLIASCDTPFLSAPLFRYLLHSSFTSPAVVARDGDRIQPLCGVYRMEALPTIEQCLAAGCFRLQDLLDRLGATFVDITPDLPFYSCDLFLNINDAVAFRRLQGMIEAGIRQ